MDIPKLKGAETAGGISRVFISLALDHWIYRLPPDPAWYGGLLGFHSLDINRPARTLDWIGKLSRDVY
jgi:hypothetical protein